MFADPFPGRFQTHQSPPGAFPRPALPNTPSTASSTHEGPFPFLLSQLQDLKGSLVEKEGSGDICLCPASTGCQERIIIGFESKAGSWAWVQIPVSPLTSCVIRASCSVFLCLGFLTYTTEMKMGSHVWKGIKRTPKQDMAREGPLGALSKYGGHHRTSRGPGVSAACHALGLA